MRANEFINEAKEGKLPKNAAQATKGTHKMRDKGGYDRTYHMNRLWMATAMADGKSHKPVDMDEASWVEKYNLARPYTKEEHMMMRSALKTVDSEVKHSETDHKSREHPDTHTISPVTNPGPIKRKNSKK